MTARLGTARCPLRVAVIGAGPAGFFTAQALLKAPDVECSIDIFNRLPTPYGLVRDGVAPDHPSIKKVTDKFDAVGADAAVRYFGNVEFGLDLTLDETRRHYHQVVYAVGAQSDRHLDIPGEHLRGSHPATEFVAWYNGHPDYADRTFPLGHERAVIVGNGNVAVDVARILATDPAALRVTDIADHALAALEDSSVREVVMLGRRGPAQAKFTSVELRELGNLEGVDVVVDVAELELDSASERAAAASRTASRNLEILRELAARPTAGASRRLVLQFLRSPAEILGEDGRVQGVSIERNRLVETASGYLRSEGVGRFETLAAGLVLRSVGYRGVPVPGVPFDSDTGTIPNAAGRVTDGPGGEAVPGTYVAGWIKRGPTGIIGTNKADAAETVSCMLEDAAAGQTFEPQEPSPGAVEDLLKSRGVRYLTFEDWKKLDAAERSAGEMCGRPRVKFIRVEDMLRVVDR